MAEIQVEYLYDTVGVKSNCFYQHNSAIASEVDLPSEVKVLEETKFFRVAEAQSEVQIQESLLETRFLADQVDISSEITSLDLEATTKECIVKIKEVLGAPLISLDVLASEVQVQDSVDGRITEVGLNSEVQVQESLSLISQEHEPLPFKKVTPPATNWNKQ
ncbi:hypothetical protein KA005_50980 [bacterium]|nr:hypothetical protein [bacterium]